MGYNNVQRPNIEAMMNLFVTLNELKQTGSIDHAIDTLDIYLRTGDEKVLPSFDNMREKVANSNFREYFEPIYENGYDHLYYYLDDIAPQKGRSK